MFLLRFILLILEPKGIVITHWLVSYIHMILHSDLLVDACGLGYNLSTLRRKSTHAQWSEETNFA